MQIEVRDEQFPMPVVRLGSFNVDLQVRSDFRWTCTAKGLIGGYHFDFDDEIAYPSAAVALESFYAALADYFKEIRDISEVE